MLHQTLIPPFSSFPSSPSLLQPPPRPLPSLPCSHSSSQVEKEGRMESPKNSFQPQTLCSGLNGDEAAWALERGSNILGDDFLVDDLLDLGGLTEPEPETEEAEEIEKKFTETEFNEEDNSNSSSSSAVSFEPSPVSEISLPAHDEAELEWVSRIMDDSLSEFPPCSGVPPYNPAPKTQTHVPSLMSTTVPVKAKRSKRTRTPSGVWSMWGPSPVADSTSTTTTTTTSSSSSCSSSSYSSYLIYDHTSSFLISGNPPPLKKQKPKKRGRKPKPPQTPSAASNVSAVGGERRCSHCGVTKTPQWRAGPMGAKTLCNACGVRYKSGRLLPEYRPACSPTFISQVHSNSHRKVLEMRRKKEEEVLLPPPRRRLPPFDPDRTGCVHFGPLKVICNGLDF